MKKFGVFLLALLLLGIPLLTAAPPEAKAQVLGHPTQALGQDPEELFEDNPDRREEAMEEGKTFVPDISALGFERKNAAAGEAIRFDNVRPKAQLGDANKGFNEAKADRADADKADRDEANKAQEDEKAFEFNQMLGNEQFNADVNGVQPSEKRMRMRGGRAVLDKKMNFEMGVKGLRFEDGQAAAGQQFKAGMACMDSGAFMARNQDAENPDNTGEGSFTVDENGDGEFRGKMDFAGASCVAPTPMVMDENNRFVGVGGHGMMSEEGMNQEDADKDKEMDFEKDADKADKDADRDEFDKDFEKDADKADKDADKDEFAKDFDKDEFAKDFEKDADRADKDAEKDADKADKDADRDKFAKDFDRDAAAHADKDEFDKDFDKDADKFDMDADKAMDAHENDKDADMAFMMK